MATLTKEITTYNSSNNANGKLRITFDYTQDIVGNTSTVYMTKVEFQSSTQTGVLYADGIIKMNGVQQVEYTNSGYDQDKCTLSSLNTYAQLGYAISNDPVVIHHNSSGVGSIPIYLGPRSSTGYSQWNIFNSSVVSGSAHIATGTVYASLPTISDTLATATPTAPVNTVEDGSAAIKFKWTLANASGIAPTKTDLQTSTDGTNWTNLATVTSGGTTYSVAADTFSAGTIYWRARAYNRDNVAGSWSSAVNFIVVAAPAAPTVLSDGAPFATITWRVEGQQAYRITVDNAVYGPYFGSEKTFTLSDYLADGEHTVSVEVQGNYGMWSAAGTYTFTVQNVPSSAVTLKGRFDIDAHLSWTTESAVDDYLIYRDGEQIGHATEKAYTDRLSLGSHVYTVVNRLTDGNYTVSNAVTGVTALSSIAIAALAGGDWVYLPLSDKSDAEQAFSKTRDYSLRHFTGSEYPELEMSSFSDFSGSYSCAFKCAKDAKPLLDLFGKTVIVKSRGGSVVVGPFAAYDRTQTDFYVVYSFSIPAMNCEGVTYA